MYTVSQIRQKFLDYFQSHGHTVVPSSPLVPSNDKTLLFTNAGMVQFKEVFLGQEKRDYQCAATSQRCVRAGGKHNDLENVGYTARHHTFFEMLGNFSFGQYFKHEAIKFAWDFLTVTLSMPEDKLWVTVFEDDDEAFEIWEKYIGVDRARIARIGAKDNFWQMGDTGPCGPCSEIFYDHGPDVWGGPPGTPDEDGDRYIEIWNLVFMQYDRQPDGRLEPLPRPSVDTGMGLERIAAVLQDVHSNYDIDLFRSLIKATADLLAIDDLNNQSLRVIADHIRSCAFLIIDGVLPSNEGRGYVLRRIIRRAVRHANKLGAESTFFHKLVKPLADIMGDAYSELHSKQHHVEEVLNQEELRFGQTLINGMKILDETIAGLSEKTLPGDIAFKLYDTFGFPIDLTADIARERGLEVDMDGFEKAMHEQRTRARSQQRFNVIGEVCIVADLATKFIGYSALSTRSQVVRIYNDKQQNQQVLSAGQNAILILDKTPFYGESGGQVGDTGILRGESVSFTVTDTQKQGDTIAHIGQLTAGKILLGDNLDTQVDSERRQAIALNHSATHLLHAALRNILGQHVEQKGSLVADSGLRFDFSHNKPVDRATLDELESWVNNVIRANEPTEARQMNMDEAIQQGAIALFGEKYGDDVRVLSMGSASIELCGGTHVNRTGDIGLFKILSETGIASGVRRIEAVTGTTALANTVKESHLIATLSGRFKSSCDKLDQKVVQLIERNKTLEKELGALQKKLVSQQIKSFNKQWVIVDGVKILASILETVTETKVLIAAADELCQKNDNSVILLAILDKDKIKLVARVSKSLTDRLRAVDLINDIAKKVGGRGGGRADMAQAGGNQPKNLPEAIAYVPEWVQLQTRASS